jgi:hypothetical protein
VSRPTGATCTGTVTLKTLSAVAARARAAKKTKKKKILTLAQASFTVAGGRTQLVSMHLSSKAKALLARVKTLRARATIVAHNNEGVANTTQSVVTLKLKKKRKHH